MRRHRRWIGAVGLCSVGAFFAFWVDKTQVLQTIAATDAQAGFEYRRTAFHAAERDSPRQASTAVTKAIEFAGGVKQSLRSPNMFVWQSIRANGDASVICLRFKYRHRGHPIKKRIAVYAKGKTFNTREVWDSYCRSGVSEMERVKRAIR